MTASSWIADGLKYFAHPTSLYAILIAATFGVSFLSLVYRCLEVRWTGITPLLVTKAPSLPVPFPLVAWLLIWAFLLQFFIASAIILPAVLIITLSQSETIENLWGIRCRDLGKYLIVGGVTGMAATIPLLLFFQICVEVPQAMGIEVAPQPVLEGLQLTKGIPTVLLTLFKAILIFPFLEELLFRGILYPLAKKFLNRWYAACLIAFLFAAMHLFPVGIPALFCMGLFLTVLYEKMGSLGYSIIAHSVYNTLGCILFLTWQKL